MRSLFQTSGNRNYYNSMLKFSVLDVLSGGGVAVSSGPAPDSAFAPSFLGRPFGQLPYPHCTMPGTSRQVKISHPFSSACATSMAWRRHAPCKTCSLCSRTVRKTRTRSPARKVGGCLFSLILREVSTESAWIAEFGIGAVAPFTDRAFNAGLQ